GLLKKMREEDIHIPVVLMTFYGSEEIAIEVFRLGVRDYVIKPFTDDELLDAIERALVETRLRRERDELERRLIETNRRLKQQIQDYGYILGLAAHLGHSDTYTIMTLLEGCAGQIGAKSLCLYLYQAGSLAESAAFGGTQADVQAVASHIARTRSAEAFQQSDELAAVGVPVLWHDRMMGILIADIPSDRVARHHLVMLQALADYLSVLVQRNNRGLDLH
ncbi:MAG: response regulator, partial [Chloroflexi bacterium]|nr:response regulator [Chloroflexota bacterium]